MKTQPLKLFVILFYIVLFFTSPIIQTEANEGEVAVEIYPEAVSYNEHAVITIHPSEDHSWSEATIDASAVGGDAEIPVDSELMEQTISVSDETTTGVKSLPINVVADDGEEYKKEVEIEIIPREIENEADFDWDEAVIYFLLTDRFMDGDPSNNNPNGEGYDTNHSESYHGGDLQGVIDQLDYIEELGVNTIWISPIVDNIDFNRRHGKEGSQYGYHGYWAKDFTQIDEHIGDLETLKTLIDEANARGIKLMVDVILNHTGYGMKSTDTGEGISNFPTADEQAVFDGMLREDPLQGHDVLGEIYGLPDFKTEEAAVRDQVIKWQTDWIERARTDKGNTIDYFRVDTVKHVEDTTWNAFKNELTKIKPDFKMIGEHYGGTYNQTGGYLNSGQMDSLLDFDFKRLAAQFVHGNIEQTEAELRNRNERIDNTATVGQFLSSHDEDGLLSHFLQGDEDLFKVASSLQLTAKGQPIIYYGEEIGMSGKAEGDMDNLEFSENREDFDWDQVDGHHLVEHYQKLLTAREAHSEIFAKGTREHLAGTNADGYSVFSRSHAYETIYVGLNTSTDLVETTVDVEHEAGIHLKDSYTGTLYTVEEDQTIDFEIPGKTDGGTVLLSVTDEEPVDNNMLLIGAIGSLGIILLGWYLRRRNRK